MIYNLRPKGFCNPLKPTHILSFAKIFSLRPLLAVRRVGLHPRIRIRQWFYVVNKDAISTERGSEVEYRIKLFRAPEQCFLLLYHVKQDDG